MDFMQILDKGFALFFGVMVILYAPKFIQVWRDFNLSVNENTLATRQVAEVVNKHFEHSIILSGDIKKLLDVIDEVKHFLSEHDKNAHDVKDKQEYIMDKQDDIVNSQAEMIKVLENIGDRLKALEKKYGG